MQVKLRLLASMRQRLPEKDKEKGFTLLDMCDGATCGDLLKHAGVWVKEGSGGKESGGGGTLVVLVNGRYASHEKKLSEGDVVAVFPTVAGG